MRHEKSDRTPRYQTTINQPITHTKVSKNAHLRIYNSLIFSSRAFSEASAWQLPGSYLIGSPVSSRSNGLQK